MSDNAPNHDNGVSTIDQRDEEIQEDAQVDESPEFNISSSGKTDGALQRGKAKEGDPDKAKKRALVIFISMLLVIIMLLILRQLGVFRFPWEKEPPKAPIISGDLFPGVGDAQDGVLSTMSKEDILEQMQKVADANYFSFKINTQIVFEDGRSEGSVGIENPNYNVYPMVVQIYLGEDGAGELIYDSGGILPNQHIDTAKLTKELPAGTYKALANLNAYDPDTQLNVFKSTAALTIIINN